MTVKELKEAIKNLPDDMEVILQIDSEGNGYETVYYADPNGIMDEDGECYDATWTAEEAGMDEADWAEFLKKPKVLVIAP